MRRPEHTFGFAFSILTVGLLLESSAEKPPHDFATMTDEQKLLIIDWLPLGSRFEDLHERVPNAPDPISEGWRLTFKDSLFGQPATFEMNYKNERLYSAFWFSKALFDSAASDSLQAEVSRIYSKRFGSSNTFEGWDAEYAERTHSWCWNGGSAMVSLFGLEKPYRWIAGGFQIPCPHDPGP